MKFIFDKFGLYLATHVVSAYVHHVTGDCHGGSVDFEWECDKFTSVSTNILLIINTWKTQRWWMIPDSINISNAPLFLVMDLVRITALAFYITSLEFCTFRNRLKEHHLSTYSPVFRLFLFCFPSSVHLHRNGLSEANAWNHIPFPRFRSFTYPIHYHCHLLIGSQRPQYHHPSMDLNFWYGTMLASSGGTAYSHQGCYISTKSSCFGRSTRSSLPG